MEEERERRLESLFEQDLENTAADRDAAALGGEGAEGGAAAPAGRRTLETVSAADSIIDALEAAALEMDRLRQADKEAAEAERAGKPPPRPLPINAVMGGMPPSAYVLKVRAALRCVSCRGLPAGSWGGAKWTGDRVLVRLRLRGGGHGGGGLLP